MSPIRRVYRRVTTTERVVIYHNDSPPTESAAERFFSDVTVEPMVVEPEPYAPLQLTAGNTDVENEDGTND
ncbi:MAG TPA: hypothetical protein DEP46_02240 [Blastocatellia bacterium]|nr:hypothetical protein [Blastocatellia bacterium]